MEMMERLLDKEKMLDDKKGPESFITQHSLIDDAKHSTRILLVEDNPLNQKLAGYMLKRAGYQMELAETAKTRSTCTLPSRNGTI